MVFHCIFLGKKAISRESREMYKKSMVHVQSCFLLIKPTGFFDVLVAVASLDLKVPNVRNDAK